MEALAFVAVCLLLGYTAAAPVVQPETLRSPNAIKQRSTPQQFCGTKLTEAFTMVCMNEQMKSRSRRQAEDNHGVVDECCVNSCTYQDIAKYCPPDANIKLPDGLLKLPERPAKPKTQSQGTTPRPTSPQPETVPDSANKVTKKKKSHYWPYNVVTLPPRICSTCGSPNY